MVDHLYSIGINRYDHHRSLRCCANDAKLFERTVRGLVPSVRSQLQIDDVESVGRRSVESLLDEVESLRLGVDDSLFFFFAGHGYCNDGRDFLVCADTRTTDGSSGVPTDDVIAALRKSGAGMTVAVFDACRDEHIRGGVPFGERTAQFAMRHNAVVFLGCSPNEVCQELPTLGDGHGVFSYALTQAMIDSAIRTPLLLEQRTAETVRRVCTQHDLRLQRPHAVVSPLSAVNHDLITKRSIPVGDRTRECILIVGPSSAGKSSIGGMLAQQLSAEEPEMTGRRFALVEMSSFAYKRYDDALNDGFEGSIQDYMERVVWGRGEHDAIALDLLEEYEGGSDVVICGARRPEEIETLRAAGWPTSMFYVYANSKIRFERYRNSVPANRYRIGRKKFIELDLREASWGLASLGRMRGTEIVFNEAKLATPIDAIVQNLEHLRR